MPLRSRVSCTWRTAFFLSLPLSFSISLSPFFSPSHPSRYRHLPVDPAEWSDRRCALCESVFTFLFCARVGAHPHGSDRAADGKRRAAAAGKRTGDGQLQEQQRIQVFHGAARVYIYTDSPVRSARLRATAIRGGRKGEAFQRARMRLSNFDSPRMAFLRVGRYGVATRSTCSFVEKTLERGEARARARARFFERGENTISRTLGRSALITRDREPRSI